MSSSYDVAIVGAGPAGSSAAIRLAKAGMTVLLVEKQEFPRQKLCGEFISPECLEHFRELGVVATMINAGGSRLAETIFYGQRGRGVRVPTEWFEAAETLALGLSRAEMDLQLMQRAREVGVDVRERTSAAAVVENSRLSGLALKSETGEEQVRSPVVIDATGRTRSVCRKLERDRPQRAVHVAFKTHAKGVAVPDDRCEIFSYPGGYGGTNRVEGGSHNLCFIAAAADVKHSGSDPEAVLRNVVRRNARADHVLRNAEFPIEWLAVPIERFGRSKPSPISGLLAVGDAASFIDPFTGSGMLLALESSRIAATSILDGGPDVSGAYDRRYNELFSRRLLVCSLLRRASFVPFLAEATIAALAASPALTRLLARSTRSTKAFSAVD